MKSTDPNILTKKQLADRLNLPSTRCVDELVRKRKIPVLRWGYRTVRFNWEECWDALQRYKQAEVK